MISLFISLPVTILAILHTVNVSVRLTDSFYLIILYLMPILGVVAYIKNDIYIEVNSIEKTITNKVADPRRDWNWSRSLEKLIKVEYRNSKEESSSVFGKKFIFSKMLVFSFQNQESKYISVSLFSRKQRESIIGYVSNSISEIKT